MELEFVKPKLVVAMGATALTALTGKQQKLGDLRGNILDVGTGRSMLVTVHPSYLLRIPDQGRQQEELARFRADLAQAALFHRHWRLSGSGRT